MRCDIEPTAFLWEHPHWPAFEYGPSHLAPALDAVRRAHEELLGLVREISEAPLTQLAVGGMARAVVQHCGQRGVNLPLESVRASMMLWLCAGEGGPWPGAVPRVDPVAGVQAAALEGFRFPLTLDRIFSWHRAIFPRGVSRERGRIRAGKLRGPEPLVVIPHGRSLEEPDIVRFEPPPRGGLEAQLEAFLAWFNAPPGGLDGLLRAGIAHLWFLTLHPLEDGNGRIARTITDLALAQDGQSALRFYSLSGQILRNKDGYVRALERGQRGNLDITDWLAWFLGQIEAAINQAKQEAHRVLALLDIPEEPRQMAAG